MKTIISFNSTDESKVDQIGGKALKLMAMYRAGLAVPPGIALSTSFFDPWIEKVKTTPEWKTLQNARVDELGGVTKKLLAFCETLIFDEAQRRDFDKAISDFQKSFSCGLFAVRSSSPEEDLDAASFAGEYETTLGVREEDLEEALRYSFASCFDERVFLYKQEHGIKTDNPRIAVLIQQQINADCAGVGFSLNPINNCYDEAVINANFGLGESVVSGTAEPDLFVVDKVKKQILERQIGEKQCSVILGFNGGIIEKSHSAQNEASITDQQALDIAGLISTVENYYRVPVDIEWAIARDILYLLQVRPITTYHPLPDEMITKPGEQKRLYANSTLIEQGVQEPLSVLGTDFLEYVLKQMSGLAGGDITGVDGVSFTAGGQYYMNVSNAMKIGGKNLALAPGSSDDQTVLDILDSIDLNEYIPAKLPPNLKGAKKGMLFSMIPIMLGIMKAQKNPEAFMKKYYEELPGQIERFTQGEDTRKTLKEHAEHLTAGLDFFFMKYGTPTWFSAKTAKARIQQLFKDKKGDIADYLVNLGMALPGNKTTEMGSLLYKIAASEEISRFDDSQSFLKAMSNKNLSPGFMAMWNEYIEEFGARCPKEIDPATLRPKENPAGIFEQAKSMAMSMKASNSGSSFFEQTVQKRETAYKVLRERAAKLGAKQLKEFEKYYHVLYTFGGFRETGKHYVIKAADLFRRKALEHGSKFAAQGRLDSATQIFDLTIADIDKANVDPSLDLRHLARQRSAFIHKLQKSHFMVRIIDSRGKIFAPPVKQAADGAFVGLPISPGTIQGCAKVLRHANEKKLLPGEILVARATDPGWTPLFINAKGIVLEIGGALQHGAVVAREYGIPCVSGISNAVDLIQDGQLIEVDGSNGIVRILEEQA